MGLTGRTRPVPTPVRDVGRTVPTETTLEVGVRERAVLPGEELIRLELRGVVFGLGGGDGQRRTTVGQ